MLVSCIHAWESVLLREGLDRGLLRIDRGLDPDAYKHVEGRVASSHPEWSPTAMRAIQL